MERLGSVRGPTNRLRQPSRNLFMSCELSSQLEHFGSLFHSMISYLQVPEPFGFSTLRNVSMWWIAYSDIKLPRGMPYQDAQVALHSSFLLKYTLRGAPGHDPRAWPLPPTWEIQLEFLVPNFCLAQPCPLQTVRLRSEPVLGRFFSVSVPLSLPLLSK